VTIRFEQVSAGVGEEDRAVVWVEWGRPKQTLTFEVAQSLARVLAPVVEIPLRGNPKRADRSEHPAFGAVDLVYAIPVPDWATLAASRQIEILAEHVSRIMLMIAVVITGPASAAAVARPSVVTIALTIARIVPVPHLSPRLPADRRSGVTRERPLCRVSATASIDRNQPLACFG
jgi:hypothetical protein